MDFIQKAAMAGAGTGFLTQELINYCALNKLYPQIKIVRTNELNETRDMEINKEGRFRYILDTESI